MQALSRSDDAILINFEAINKLSQSLNDLLTAEVLGFDTARVSRMTAFFDHPVFVTDEQTDNNRIKENIVRNILNDGKINFPTYTYHISLSNTAEETKKLSIDENKLFIEIELKKNKRDYETLENLVDDAKRDLIKTFVDPRGGIIVASVKNVIDWVNKADEENNS